MEPDTPEAAGRPEELCTPVAAGRLEVEAALGVAGRPAVMAAGEVVVEATGKPEAEGVQEPWRRKSLFRNPRRSGHSR